MSLGRASGSGARGRGHVALGLVSVVTALHLAGASLAVPPGLPMEVRAAAARVCDQRSVQRFTVATGAAAPLPQRARALHCEIGLAE